MSKDFKKKKKKKGENPVGSTSTPVFHVHSIEHEVCLSAFHDNVGIGGLLFAILFNSGPVHGAVTAIVFLGKHFEHVSRRVSGAGSAIYVKFDERIIRLAHRPVVRDAVEAVCPRQVEDRGDVFEVPK